MQVVHILAFKWNDLHCNQTCRMKQEVVYASGFKNMFYFEIKPDIPPDCQHPSFFQSIRKQWNENSWSDSLHIYNWRPGTQQQNIIQVMSKGNGRHVNTQQISKVGLVVAAGEISEALTSLQSMKK